MTHALELKHLSMNFGGLKVTDDVSLTLPVGARTALIGPNGAGKTTLINLISGLLNPTRGQVFLMGEDVTSHSPATRVHRGMIRSFQVTRLFQDMTIAEHLSFAIRARNHRMGGVWRAMTSDRATEAEGTALIESLGLGPLRNRRVDEIAYGQQRLVEIAIALAMKPKVRRFAEQIVVLAAGQIIATGTPAEISHNEQVRSAYLGE